MANEVRIPWPTGYTLYGVVFRNTDNKIWYPAGSSWEAWGTDSHTIADYKAVTITEPVSGACRYVGDFPTAITTAGKYDVQARVQSGAYPVNTDNVAGMVEVDWRGTVTTIETPAVGLSALILEVQQLTGHYGDTELVTAARCIRWFNEAQIDIATYCKGHLDLEYKHETAIALEADTYVYSVASFNPLLLHFLKAFYIDGDSSKELDYTRTEDFDLAYPNPGSLSRTGIPNEVTKRANSLEIIPVPTSAEEGKYLRVDYIKRPTSFSTDDLSATCDMTDADEGLIYFGVSKAFKAIGGDKLPESDRYWQYYIAWRESYKQQKDNLLMSGVDNLLA